MRRPLVIAVQNGKKYDESSKYDYEFKIKIFGGCGVGKSSLVCRYVDDTFVDSSNSLNLGVEFKTKIIDAGNSVVKTQVWDPPSQGEFRSAYAKGQQICIVVFDLTDNASFSEAQELIDRLPSAENSTFILVGNKADLMDSCSYPVTQDKVDTFINNPKRNISAYLQASAKTGDNVKLLFEKACELYLAMQSEEKNKPLSSNSNQVTSSVLDSVLAFFGMKTEKSASSAAASASAVNKR